MINLAIFNAALRQFRRARQYYLTVVASLILTLVMLFSVFSILDVAYLKPLPYGKADQLYFVEGTLDYQGQDMVGTNPGNLLTLQQQKVFPALAIYFSWTDYKLYELPGRPDVPVYMASSNFFDVLQVKPVLGRFFTEQESTGNKQTSAVLSYQVWQQHFGGSADVIGQTVQLNERRFVVIGVAPDEWVLPQQTNVSTAIWLPLDMDEQLDPKTFGGYSGAVKGLTRLDIEQQNPQQWDEKQKQLQKHMASAAAQNTPDILKDFAVSARLTSFTEAVRGDSGKIIMMLIAGVMVLTFIALINLGNLQLARAIGRVKSVAISYAFGATRRQLFTEILKHNLVVTATSALFALLLTGFSFGILRNVGASVLPRLDALGLSLYIWLFAAAVTLVIAFIFSWIELKAIDESQLQASLQSSGKGTGKQLKKGLSHSLIGAQLLFSMLTLIAGSQVLMASLTEALRPTQITTANLWSVVVNYGGINDLSERLNVQRNVAQVLKSTAGVIKVSRSSETRIPEPFNRDSLYSEQGESLSSARIIGVDEQNLQMYGMTIQGRFFSRDDLDLEYKPAIINQRLAAKFAGNPLGQKIALDGSQPYEIVGVVSNTDFPGGVSYEADELFLPGQYGGNRTDVFLLAVSADFKTSHAAFYAALLKIDPRLDLVKITAVDQDFTELSRHQQFAAWLSGIISVASLMMVLAGITGMVSYMIRMRRYDLGVKLAMGATQKLLLRSQLIELARPIAIATLVAFSVAYFLIGYSRTVPELHFALYWPELLLSVVMLVVFAMVSCFIPVWQVLKADPIKALRNE